MAYQPYTEVSNGAVETSAERRTATNEVWAAAAPARTEDGDETARRWYFEDGMAKRIIAIVMVVLLGYLVYLGISRYSAARNSGNGDVKVDSTSARDDGSPDNDAPPAPVRTARQIPQQTATTLTTMAPSTDSIPPNPANGAAFAGTGQFQVYRQGNLTWRVDTVTGHTCILFATMEEWRKPVVYQHACENS